MLHTLQPVVHTALALISKLRKLEQRRNEGDEVEMPVVTVKKVFQFVHKTTTVLVGVNPEVALQLWFVL